MRDFNSEAVVNGSVVVALYLISYDPGTLTFPSHDRRSPLLRPALQQVLMPCSADLYTMPFYYVRSTWEEEISNIY